MVLIPVLDHVFFGFYHQCIKNYKYEKGFLRVLVLRHLKNIGFYSVVMYLIYLS